MRGDVITFVREMEHLDFVGAVESLAARAGITLHYDSSNEGEGRKKRKELVEVRNIADSLIYSTEKSLKEYGGKVGEAEKGAIEADLAALKEAVKADDAAAIKSKTEALSQSSMKLGEAMYKASQEAAEGDEAASDKAGAAGAAGDKGEDVVDADFEEVDDDKNDKKKSA